jgi:hypothetical protein
MTSLTIQLMDSDYNRLIKEAKQVGKSVQEFIYSWIKQLPEIEETFDVTQDPIYTMEGFESEAQTDLSINPDKYIYG